MQDSKFTLGSWGQNEVFIAAFAVFATILLLSWISKFLGGHRLPPGPRGWLLLGALPYVGEFPHKSLYELSKKYGPVMYMHLGSIPTLLISNGEMAKEVLQNNDQNFASRPRFLISTYLTYGGRDMAASPYGPYWRELRKTVSLNLLTSSRIPTFTKIVNDEILRAIHTVLEQAQSGGKKGANVSTVLNGMTMNIITMIMWNKRQRNVEGSESINDKKFEKLFRDLADLLAANNIEDFLPSFLQTSVARLSGLSKKVKKVHGEFDSFLESIICEKEQALASAMGTKAATDEDDFVDVLLKLLNQPAEGSQRLSRDTVKGVLLDMIAGGTDTTSITLDWILAQLLKRPDIMKKAQDELITVVGADRLVNDSDIPNLKYLDAVVKEGLRMFSATPLGLPHFSQADCKIGGYDVPANTTVFINIYAIHHNSTVWENPWEFNPDRFLHSSNNYKGQNYDFIPFSSGRRMCPGMNFAASLVHIGLAQFLHAVTWSLPEGQGPEDVDMRDTSGLTTRRATPLVANAQPKLAQHVIYSTVA